MQPQPAVLVGAGGKAALEQPRPGGGIEAVAIIGQRDAAALAVFGKRHTDRDAALPPATGGDRLGGVDDQIFQDLRQQNPVAAHLQPRRRVNRQVDLRPLDEACRRCGAAQRPGQIAGLVAGHPGGIARRPHRFERLGQASPRLLQQRPRLGPALVPLGVKRLEIGDKASAAVRGGLRIGQFLPRPARLGRQVRQQMAVQIGKDHPHRAETVAQIVQKPGRILRAAQREGLLGMGQPQGLEFRRHRVEIPVQGTDFIGPRRALERNQLARLPDLHHMLPKGEDRRQNPRRQSPPEQRHQRRQQAQQRHHGQIAQPLARRQHQPRQLKAQHRHRRPRAHRHRHRDLHKIARADHHRLGRNLRKVEPHRNLQGLRQACRLDRTQEDQNPLGRARPVAAPHLGAGNGEKAPALLPIPRKGGLAIAGGLQRHAVDIGQNGSGQIGVGRRGPGIETKGTLRRPVQPQEGGTGDFGIDERERVDVAVFIGAIESAQIEEGLVPKPPVEHLCLVGDKIGPERRPGAVDIAADLDAFQRAETALDHHAEHRRKQRRSADADGRQLDDQGGAQAFGRQDGQAHPPPHPAALRPGSAPEAERTRSTA